MSLHRRNPRRDLTEPVIVLALLQAGFSVKRISGEDVPDLVLGRNGIDVMAEVKTGKKKLKPGQAEFAEAWRGRKPLVLRSLDDVLVLLRSWPQASAGAER